MLQFPASDPKKILAKARKLHSQGRTDRAIKTIEAALKGGAEDFGLLLELGRIDFEWGKVKEAFSAWKKAQTLLPSRTRELLTLVEDLHYRGEKPPETAELLLELYLENREFQEADGMLSSLESTSFEELSRRYETIYNNLFKGKSFEELSGRDLVIHYSMALIHERAGKLDKAYPILHRIAELSPEEGENLLIEGRRICQAHFGEAGPHLFLGDLLLKTKDLEEATKELRKAVELDKALEPEVSGRLARMAEESPTSFSIEALIDVHISNKRFDEATDLVARLVELDDTKVDNAMRKFREILRLDSENLKAHLSLGDLHLTKGRMDLALSEFSRVIEIDPKMSEKIIEKYLTVLEKEPQNPLAITYLADAYLKEGELAKAVSSLKEGYRSNPSLGGELIPRLEEILKKDLENPQATALLAQIYWEKGEKRKALPLYDWLSSLGADGPSLASEGLTKALETDPSNAKARLLLGMALAEKGDFEGALQNLRSVLESNEGSGILSRLDKIARRRPGLAEGIVTIYAKLVEYGIDPFLLSFASGEAYLAAGDLGRALDNFQKCLEIDGTKTEEVVDAYKRILARDSRFAQGHFALADLHLSKGEVDQAISEFEAVVGVDEAKAEEVLERYYSLLKTEEGNPQLLRATVELLAKRGVYNQVVSQCETALDTLPPEESGYFRFKIGEAHLRLGHLSGAASCLTKLVDLHPSFGAEAIPLLNSLISLAPFNVQAGYSLAKAYLAAQDFDKSVERFATIVEIDSSKTAEVLKEIDEIIRVAPTNALAHYTKANLLLKSDKLRNAIGEFEKSLELGPEIVDKVIGSVEGFLKTHEDATGYLVLGRALLRNGQYQEAALNLSKALSLDQNLKEPVISSFSTILKEAPLNTGPRFTLAEIFREEGEFAKTVELLREIEEIDEGEREMVVGEYEKIISLAPSNIPVRYALAESYGKLGREDEAVVQYETVLELSPEEMDSVVSSLRELAQRKNRNVLLSLARLLTKRGEYQEATGVVKQTVEHHPRTVDEGIEILNEILSLSPKGVEPSSLLGELHILKEDYPNARTALERAIRFAKEAAQKSDLYLTLSRALYGMGDEKGKRAFEKAQELSLDSSQFYQRLEGLREERLSSLMGRERAALENSPQDPQIAVRLASLLRRAGRIEEAMNLLRFSSDSDRIAKLRAMELSSCLATSGDLLGGLEVLREVELSEPPSPEDKEVLYRLALLYERIGELSPAISAMRRAAEQDYGDAARKLKDLWEKVVEQKLRGGARVIEGATRLF